ncbi:MAG: hypothetical protein IPM06_21145 [Rhizobiales bacterium]|nr:hypothetical protein [Hyphomicrobiales bacterium]
MTDSPLLTIQRAIRIANRRAITGPAGDRILDAFGATNSQRAREARTAQHRMLIAFVAGALIGCALILIFGDVPARTAETVLQAQEMGKW